MLEISKLLFYKWNQASVRYCHWKSNEHLDDGLNGLTDLDVYVFPSDSYLAESILKENNYLRCVVQKENEYDKVNEWIGFDSESGKLVHIHLHYAVITGTKFCKEYVFPIDDLLIKTRVLDERTGVYITNPNLEIIILYARIALKARDKNNIIPEPDEEREIYYLKERLDNTVVKQNCIILLHDYADKFFRIILKSKPSVEDWYSIYQISSNWLNSYRRYSKLQVFFRFRFFAVKKKLVYILNSRFKKCIIDQKTFDNRSLVICFLGQDGSGKSTVSKDICQWLNWKMSAKCFYLGSGSEFYNPWQRKFLKKLNKTNNSLLRPIRYWLYFSELLATSKYVYKTIKKAYKYSKNGGIALLDRYPQIEFPGINDGPKIRETLFERVPKGFLWLAEIYAKREEGILTKTVGFSPSIVFKLLLSPEESIRRKPLENYDMVSIKHNIVKQLKFPKSQVEVIDAEQPYETEVLLIKKIIWERLQK